MQLKAHTPHPRHIDLSTTGFDFFFVAGSSFMRGFIGGFLRLPPVKKGLMSNALRSRFLGAMKKGAAMQGKGWALDI